MPANAKTPAVNPAVSAAGDEGLNPNHQQIEGVTPMFSFECPDCEYNILSHDAEALDDEVHKHRDYHVYAAEFEAKKRRTHHCPLPGCGWSVSDKPALVADLVYRHNESHLELADSMNVKELASANIVRPTTKTLGGGVRIALDRIETFGLFGETESVDYDLTFGKAHGADDDPSLDPSQIPALIAELERLHEAWKARTDLRVILRDAAAIQAAAEYREDL